MNRIIVIGCPGSGKSVFSRALSAKTGIPLFHLDRMYWQEDRTAVDRAVFLKRLREALSGERWIIDGNYGSTMEMRMNACDTVFFLDYPRDVCLAGVRSRQGKPRSDMPWTEVGEDSEFIRFIEDYAAESRPKVLALLEKYRDREIRIFHSRAEADAWLNLE